jgi:hypothetical protein
MPHRIQRKRIKGYRMPQGARYVGRPTILGNPFKRGGALKDDEILGAYELWLRYSQQEQAQKARERLPELRGLDLACFCRTDAPCHADVLLRLANA